LTDLRLASQPLRGERYLLLGVLLASGLLRALVLNARSLWFDEAFSVAVARLPWRDIWSVVARTDPHPPLYYLLLHFWLRVGDTPGAVRMFSLFFGLLTVAATWLLGREVGGRVLAVISAMLIGAGALAIQSSVEARMYPLLTFAAVASTWLLWRAAAEPARRGRWAAYAVSLGVAFYIDYLAVLLVPAHLLYAARSRRGDSSPWPILVAVAGAVLLYAPWWSAIARQLATGQATTVWKGAMPATAPLNMVALSGFGGYLLGLGGYLLDDGRWAWRQLLLVLPFLVFAVFGAGSLPRPGAGRLLLLLWFIPALLLVAASLLTGVFYAIPRLASFVQPFFLILLAQGIISLAGRARRPLTLALLVTGVVVLNLTVLRLELADARYQPYDWAGAARRVQADWQPGDQLLFYPQTARVAFGYYFRTTGNGSVTLYAPPWTVEGTRAQYVEALPPMQVLSRGAHRLWLVTTEPTPPGSLEALVEVVGRTYRLLEALDFRHVYVLLYEKR